MRKRAASAQTVSLLSALSLWSRFPSSSSSVSALRAAASGGFPALIDAEAQRSLSTGGRQQQLKSRLFWKEAGASARAVNSSSPPPFHSHLAEVRVCLRVPSFPSPEYLIMAFPCLRATQDGVEGKSKKKNWLHSLWKAASLELLRRFLHFNSTRLSPVCFGTNTFWSSEFFFLFHF